MFKFLGASLLLGLGVSAVAQNKTSTNTAPYYILNEWPGAYQDGYEVQDEITLDLYQSPTNPINIGFCTLKKGRSFHPYSTQNKNDKFIVVSGVKTYQATMDVTDDSGYNYKKGDTVLQLAELSEGVCLNQVGHKITEESCVFMYEGWELILASPLEDHRMIETTCDEGGKGWIKEAELEAHVQEDASSSVRTLSDDEVHERGWNLD